MFFNSNLYPNIHTTKQEPRSSRAAKLCRIADCLAKIAELKAHSQQKFIKRRKIDKVFKRFSFFYIEKYALKPKIRKRKLETQEKNYKMQKLILRTWQA